MEKLIEMVRALNSNEALADDTSKYLVVDEGQYTAEDKAESDRTVYFMEGESGYAELSEINNLACGAFITSRGVNYDAIAEFKRLTGYSVVRGESDSCGWLSGVINMKKGMFVFG